MATIRDIAKESGISAGAVSRILNNDASLSVSDETRMRVIEIAKKLNYKKTPRLNTPSRAAFTMGIVQWYTPEIEQADNYYLRARQGIEDFCSKNAIQIIRVSPGEADTKKRLKSVNGLICLGKFSDDEVKDFINICKNIVFLDMEVSAYQITSLSMDFEEAVYSALNYLTSLGHKKIAYLGGKEYVGNNVLLNDPRAFFFKKYMEHRQISFNGYFKEGKFSLQSGYNMMEELFHEKKIPTAIFAANDAIAYGAMKSIKEHGLKIPEDISIIGFNDEETSAFMSPPLTTIHAPSYDMGQHGANLVYVASNLSIKTPIRAKIPCTLIKRESCKKL